MKQCSKCKQLRPLSEFGPDKRVKDGLKSWCNQCHKDWRDAHPEYIKSKGAKWRKNNPDYGRNWLRENKYGVTVDWVETKLKEQSGRCVGCGLLFTLEDREHVDHCHATKKLRGLLCRQCNLILGWVNDNPVTLENLANYLRVHQS